MPDQVTPGSSRPTGRPSAYTAVTSAPESPEVPVSDVEQRVAITLSVADGFKFGCGLLLAGLAFYFAVVLVVGVALLFAAILGLPLPFGLGGR